RTSGEADKADLSAIVGFAAVGRSAETVETLGIGISIEVQRFYFPHPSGKQSMDDIILEIEMRLFRWAIGEESLVIGVVSDEMRAECVVDLIGWLGNARPDPGG